MESIRALWPLWAYLGVLNVVTFTVYAADKAIAKRKKGGRRVPERTLLLLSFLGGCVGACIGMYLLRHKTKHTRFVILVPLSAVLWAIGVAALLLYMNHIF